MVKMNKILLNEIQANCFPLLLFEPDTPKDKRANNESFHW